MKRSIKCLAAVAALLALSLSAFAYQPQSSSSSSGSPTPAKKKTSSKKHHSRREPTQKAPTAARISEIQSALARNGYYQGQPNGKWDSNTVSAMQKFQSSNGLEASGKLNALSLQKLGLGSSIAGVSAPKPKQPTSNSVPAQPPSAGTPQPGTAPSNSSSTSAANSIPSAPTHPPQP